MTCNKANSQSLKYFFLALTRQDLIGLRAEEPRREPLRTRYNTCTARRTRWPRAAASKADAEGLWAKMRWTSKGRESVEGGEYRLVSPVFPKTRYYIDGAWYDGDGTFISWYRPATSLRNRSGAEQKLYKWVLGETKSGTHCPECEARAGKVKTIAEWKAIGEPKCKCKCRLVPQ